jgi:hypothetical protein
LDLPWIQPNQGIEFGVWQSQDAITMQLEYVFWIYLTEIVIFNLDAHEKYYYYFSNYIIVRL